MSSSETICSRRAQRGFVLATTLLVTTLLTVMLTASFLLVSAEQRTTDNSLGTARALVLAQAGLQNYFSQNRGLDTSSTYDSTRIALTGGYADVVARRVRPAGAAVGSPLALWVVRSSGVATTAVMAGQAQGSRTIAQFAQLNPGRLPARAGMVAANGVQMQAGQNTNPISGKDANFCSPKNDTTALTTYAGGYNPAGSTPFPQVSGGQLSIETIGAAPEAVIDATHIDWPSLLGGNFLPDYTIPPDPWPPTGSNKYPVGWVPGAGGVTIPAGQRRGMLVVQGDVQMADNAHWDGIIIAGGNLQAAPGANSYTIHGMAITGLNSSVGGNPGPNQIKRSNNITIEWASCYTGPSVLSLSSLVPIRNAWADTWSTY